MSQVEVPDTIIWPSRGIKLAKDGVLSWSLENDFKVTWKGGWSAAISYRQGDSVLHAQGYGETIEAAMADADHAIDGIAQALLPGYADFVATRDPKL